MTNAVHTSPAAFTRAWERFNAAAPFGAAMTRPGFADLVLRAPELFASYIVEAAKAYIDARREFGP